MQNIPRPAPFVLISSNHGAMIINRNDYHQTSPSSAYGVGYQLMVRSGFDQDEVDFSLSLLHARRKHFGDGVVAIDCGANIGAFTIEWARLMFGWGHVISFEAQEKIFYALAGNVVLNNCLNVTARHAAVGATASSISIPEPNYYVPSSFGSLELRATANNEFIGQNIDYSTSQQTVPMVAIDSIGLHRLDLLKIDVEGMEEEVLAGARDSIAKFKPIMLIEVLKSDREKIERTLSEARYTIYRFGINILAIHESDPTIHSLKIDDGILRVGL